MRSAYPRTLLAVSIFLLAVLTWNFRALPPEEPAFLPLQLKEAVVLCRTQGTARDILVYDATSDSFRFLTETDGQICDGSVRFAITEDGQTISYPAVSPRWEITFYRKAPSEQPENLLSFGIYWIAWNST